MRLIDMGVEPYLVTSTMIGAMAQRLIRKNCAKCKRPDPADPAKFPADLKAEVRAGLLAGRRVRGLPQHRLPGPERPV